MQDAAPTRRPLVAPDWEDPLDEGALGVPPGAARPFDYAPGAEDSPLLISFPHVGLDWPSAAGPRPQVSFARNADFEVDAIYPPPERCPAARVRSRYSRLVVDLNRAEDDVSPRLVPDHPAPRPRPQAGGGARTGIENRGVLWSHAVGRIPILRELSHEAFEARLAAFHRPYYRALELLLQARVRRFGYAILLDAHSMPSAVQEDLVLGTLDGESCAPAVAQAAQAALTRRSGLRCRLNHPYRGGEIVRRFGRPDRGVHALQLEVNRALYMDELRLTLHGPADADRRGKRRSDAPRAIIAAAEDLVTQLAQPRLAESLNEP